MRILKRIGLVSTNSKSVDFFEAFTGESTFLDLPVMTPKEYVDFYWSKYIESGLNRTADGKPNYSLNGKIFELIIYTLLYKENILPYYVQANVAFVPNVEYDTILYSHENPICLSLKTSLRERYKQADLEAIALKYVHRKAQCYLLSLDEEEVDTVNTKIKEGSVIGLNKAYCCKKEEFNNFVNGLKQGSFVEAGTVNVIEGRLVNR